MTNAIRIIFIGLFLVLGLGIYFAFFFKGKPFKVQFINETGYEINELAFHLTNTKYNIQLKNNETSDIFDLNDQPNWTKIFSEAMMGIHIRKFTDSLQNTSSYKYGRVIGRSELSRDNINRVILYWEPFNKNKFRIKLVD